ncbi:hypothetical protein D3C87_1374510 [compost metagenome]
MAYLTVMSSVDVTLSGSAMIKLPDVLGSAASVSFLMFSTRFAGMLSSSEMLRVTLPVPV